MILAAFAVFLFGSGLTKIGSPREFALPIEAHSVLPRGLIPIPEDARAAASDPRRPGARAFCVRRRCFRGACGMRLEGRGGMEPSPQPSPAGGGRGGKAPPIAGVLPPLSKAGSVSVPRWPE